MIVFVIMPVALGQAAGYWQTENADHDMLMTHSMIQHK